MPAPQDDIGAVVDSAIAAIQYFIGVNVCDVTLRGNEPLLVHSSTSDPQGDRSSVVVDTALAVQHLVGGGVNNVGDEINSS